MNIYMHGDGQLSAGGRETEILHIIPTDIKHLITEARNDDHGVKSMN